MKYNTSMTTSTPQFSSLRQKIAFEKQARLARNDRFRTDWAEACAAGDAAVSAMTPEPMVVTGREGSYFVEGGVCGFAQVQVRPRTSAFARWLIAQGIARSSDYYKCVYVSVSQFGQSLQRKEAWAKAVADHLTAKGYDRVSWDSRID
jgi:predicted nucleic acid-binding Zn finger protein